MTNIKVNPITTDTSPSPLQKETRKTYLPRNLSAIESLGFSLTGILIWQETVASLHAGLNSAAIWVWIPGAIVAIALNLQLKHFASHFPNVAGGTPNYITRLLNKHSCLGIYAASGYYLSWAAGISINAIFLVDLIKIHTDALGIGCPQKLLQIFFTLIPFILAFSGTRALAIVHIIFMIAVIGFLFAFVFQGIGWLAFSPTSPGLFADQIPSLQFTDWAKWYLIAAYAFYASEGGAAFVADSRKPNAALNCLSIVAGMIPIIFIGGSWVVARLATNPDLGDSAFLNLVAAARPFWGNSASFLVTLLIAFTTLLSSATTVALCARSLYQLGLDGNAAPVFGVVSKRGVLTPALTSTLILSIICLLWGNVVRIIVITGIGYLISIMAFHLGLWLNRHKRETRWPRWSLGCFILEAIVLVFGGLAWDWQDFLIGLCAPIGLLAINAIISRTSVPIFQPQWWQKFDRVWFKGDSKEFIWLQINVVILLVCGATTIGWSMRSLIDQNITPWEADLLVILVLTVGFVGVAIACWTILPQVTAIAEARHKAERLFKIAQHGILVLDESGKIQQANPAAAKLFGIDRHHLVGYYLQYFLPELTDHPHSWRRHSEQTFKTKDSVKTIEISISVGGDRENPEYLVILLDVSERVEHEAALCLGNEKLQEKTKQLEKSLQELQTAELKLIQSEKMSALGNLVAGVAHEINNPVGFISGNIELATAALKDLVEYIQLYQEKCPNPAPEIIEKAEEIELDYILEDLPKMLESMKTGTERICNISNSLRTFSRGDTESKVSANIHAGIDSTLMILYHRLKAKDNRPEIFVIKDYGDIGPVKCYLGQMNQVFMNIIANAIDALEESNRDRTYSDIQKNPNTIAIKTQLSPDGQSIEIKIKDNGFGMSESVKTRIFDHLYTTKLVGKGTGLGLSISRQIIEETHGGSLTCKSKLGEGTEFAIAIPINS